MLGEGRWKSVHGGLLFSIAILSTECSGDRGARARARDGGAGHSGLEDVCRFGSAALPCESRRIRAGEAVSGASGSLRDARGHDLAKRMLWPPLLLNSDVLCGDTIAVRSRAEQLARLAKDFPSFGIHADAARAAYLMLRGDLPEAIALYEKVVPEMSPRRRVLWLNVRACFGRALNAAGQHARARQVLSDASPALRFRTAIVMQARAAASARPRGVGARRPSDGDRRWTLIAAHRA